MLHSVSSFHLVHNIFNDHEKLDYDAKQHAKQRPAFQG